MNRVMCLCFFILGSLGSSYGKGICDFADVECMTRAANGVFNKVIAGVKDLIEPVDPIVVPKFEGELLTLKYKLTNATLKGLKNCHVTQLILNKEKATFEHDLQCPEISISFTFETEGSIDQLEANGKGSASKVLDDYMLIIKGKYGKFISEKDQHPRIFINGFDVESIPRGPVKFEVNELNNGDKAKFDQVTDYLNQRWNSFETRTRSSLMTAFMGVLMKAIDTYLRTFPLEEIIPA